MSFKPYQIPHLRSKDPAVYVYSSSAYLLHFPSLSYVPLSDNEKTDFKARELKSVYMDAVGQYLKLIFHKNYVNKYNLYGQVSYESLLGNPHDTSVVQNRQLKSVRSIFGFF